MTDFKGPWSQGPRGPNNCPIIGTGKGLMICMLAANTNEHPEYEAYANLIAAAPELLVAAEQALALAESWIHDQLDGTADFDGTIEELEPIRRIIAKAKGEK